MAKRAVRSAQAREENPPCEGLTGEGKACRALSVTQWYGLHVCAMHDPEGKFCTENPNHRLRVLASLRTVKKTDVARLEDRLTALLLARYGPTKGTGLIG